MRGYFNENSSIRFLFPIDGDCVNARDGRLCEEGLRIPASVAAPEGHGVVINGSSARYECGAYHAAVTINGWKTVIEAKDLTDGASCEISVFYLPDMVDAYRLSSDDNILFLWEINEHRDEYRSIFENPYLAVYKKAHDLWGAKAHLNLFCEFDEKARTRFSKDRPYFNLSMMTDRFKDEFRANADWLQFSFHARSEYPDKPYRNADGETVRDHCERVHAEIRRFAGEECLSHSTTVHWGEANEEGARTLRALGYCVMTGYFIPSEIAPVSYYAPEKLVEHIFERDFWYDTHTDILFGRIDRVLNVGTFEENINALDDIMASPTRGGFVSVMIHEQYFYEDYRAYLPDFEKRVLAACELLVKNGYVGKFIARTQDT